MQMKPILFSGPMIRAILSGVKTQTRRIIKPQPGDHPDDDGYMSTIEARCLYSAGMLLWVRETWATAAGGGYDAREDRGPYWYRATDSGECDGPWRPSIFMPRDASRITLEVTTVRAQRLQEISEEDAVAEGAMLWWDALTEGQRMIEYAGGRGPVAAFHALWDSINAKRGCGWGVNPWVWAVTFRRVKS